MTRPLGRFEGRLFAEDGCLFMVVRANEVTGEARVTCRVDGHTQVIEMPVADVARRVSANAGLMLDNLNGPNTAKRLLQKDDGWYFASREGDKGPFLSRKEAAGQLIRYVLCMQTQPDAAPREPLRAERRVAAAG